MAWRIPESEIERVKRGADLVALVQSRGIELKKHGSKDWIGRCPFHKDNETPNFIVSPEKGLFHCMACGVAGNSIQFVERHDGVSFRHAFELLAEGHRAAFTGASHEGPLKQSTVARLPCPLDPEADDATLMGQVAAYYHERLKSLQTATMARAYLAGRGLDAEELMDRFQLGFADRTLGLRLPFKNRKEGQTLRTRLQQLGLWRESGHEHFNGCIVVPLFNDAGHVVSFYGRRAQKGEMKHLYPPGPHRGLLNREAFASDEIILCEAVLDALTFCAHGFPNTTCLFGTEGFTDELWEALKRVRRVYLAYDADDAGERAAQRDAERFRAHGVEVFRIKFPWGMDANEYGNMTLQPNAATRLQLLLNSAVWLSASKRPSVAGESGGATGDAASGVQAWPAAPAPSLSLAACVSGSSREAHGVQAWPGLTACVSGSSREAHGVQALPGLAACVSGSSRQAHGVQALPGLAACVSGSEDAAKNEKQSVGADAAPICVNPCPSVVKTALEQRGDAWFLEIEGREYRVAGLEKTIGTDALKIVLRLQVLGQGTALFHLDQIDLTRDSERRRFIERAAEETGLTPELLKRDLGKLLLAVEQAQIELLRPQEATGPQVTLTPEEREQALAWLSAPGLIGRLREAFGKSGLIGEETNTLVAYLACVSRKLERPLAVIIQSASAAGKTTLMDAVLNFFPEEDRVKYSAMTGQSLYYLGETSLKHKILAVVEEAGAERASYALKLLQSEGELTIASTGKDPQSGKMVTQEYHVEGPVMIFLTTTAIDLDEELQNRCLTLAVDESAEQTERIHRVQRERRTLAGLIAKEERKDLLKQLRNAQRLLQPVEVLNPFAPALTFASARTRNRRDHEKYLTLIDAIALLHQHQRERKVLAHGHQPNAPEGTGLDYMEVRLDDIALANQLAPEVLGRSLDELPPQTRRLLGFIRQLMKENRQERGGKSATTFSRKELRDACGWSLTQVRVHLERLVELEYLAVRHGRLGRQFVYDVLFDLDAPESVAHVGLIDVEKLKGSGTAAHDYKANLAGFGGGVAGQNGHLAGGNETPPPPVLAHADNALAST